MGCLKEWMNMKSSNENLNRGLILQFISLLVLIVLVMWTIFNKAVLPYADFVAGITFFIMAFNKKGSKLTSTFCIIFGILFVLMGGWNIFNG